MDRVEKGKSRFPQCSFCGKLKSQVRVMITADNGAQICDHCIRKMAQDAKPNQPGE